VPDRPCPHLQRLEDVDTAREEHVDNACVEDAVADWIENEADNLTAVGWQAYSTMRVVGESWGTEMND
jgi:hypothetical protein